jgi:hypothetical protein
MRSGSGRWLLRRVSRTAFDWLFLVWSIFLSVNLNILALCTGLHIQIRLKHHLGLSDLLM